MTGRTPACEDSAAIGERLREIQRERMARIAGCACGTLGPSQRDVAGNLVHAPQCPLRAPPSQAALALAVAMERLRTRHKRRTADAEAQWELFDRNVARIERAIAMQKASVEEIERATEAMAARHRVLS